MCSCVQEASLKRKQHLSSLYDFMQGCNKEQVYLNDQQKKIMRRDWSDRMIDSTEVRLEYEVRAQHSFIAFIMFNHIIMFMIRVCVRRDLRTTVF